MSKLASTLHEIVATLRPFRPTLVGGLAVSVRTEPRFTRDVDLAIGVSDDAAAEAVTQRVLGLGYAIEALIEHTPSDRIATVRLRRAREPVVDLLFASSGIEPEIAAAAEDLVVLGDQVPVATVGHLVAMKLLSHDANRPRDLDDLLQLRSVATDEEWQRARSSVALIESRGFARGRDLMAALANLRARTS